MTTRSSQLSSAGRRWSTAVCVGVAALTLSACQVASPITTDMEYDPADGVSTNVADLNIRDILVVSEGEGEPGQLVGYVANKGEEPVTLQVALTDRTDLEPAIEIAPESAAQFTGEAVLSNGGTEPITLPAVDPAPGAYIDLRFRVGDEVSSATAPVLPPSRYYEGLAPEPTGETE